MSKDSSKSVQVETSATDTDARVESPQQKPSGLWVSIIGAVSIAAFYFLSQLIGGFLVYLYPVTHHWTDTQASNWLTTSTYAQFFYILIAEGLMILGLIWLLRLFKWTWRTIGLVRPKLSQMGLGIIAAIPYYALYLAVVMVVSAFVPALNVEQDQEIGFNYTKGAVELLLTFIALVVLPPLVEELTMRGFLYTSLRKAFPKVLSALLVSGIFGAAHLAEGGAAGPLWIGAIDTFVLSMVLVYLREKTGNLWAGITLHAVKNGIAYFLLYIAPIIGIHFKM